MRTIQKTLILLGLVGILTLLAVSFACGGDGGNGDSGSNGDQPAATATSTSDTPAATTPPRPTTPPECKEGYGGAPCPEEFVGGEEIDATRSSTEMVAIGADGVSGTLELVQIERQTKVIVILTDAGAGPYSAAVRRGGCPDEGDAPEGQFDYGLFDVVDGESISMVNTPAQFFQFSLAYVIVHDGADPMTDPAISCGNIPSPLR